MSSLVSSGVRSVAGKITRPGLDTRSSRPPASTIVASVVPTGRTLRTEDVGAGFSLGRRAGDAADGRAPPHARSASLEGAVDQQRHDAADVHLDRDLYVFAVAAVTQLHGRRATAHRL